MRRVIYVSMALIFCLSLDAQSAEPKSDNKPINFYEVVPGGIFRGGQPTRAQMETLIKEKKIKTVVKLDLKSEERVDATDNFDEEAVVKELGIAIVDASTPPSTLTLPNSFRDPDYNKIRLAVETLEDESKWPIYVHCKHGQDRTGLVVGLFRVLNANKNIHKDINAAYQEMKDYKFHPLPGLLEYWRKFEKLNGKELPKSERR